MSWWQFWKREKEAPALQSFEEAPVIIIKGKIGATGGFVRGQGGGKVEDQAGEQESAGEQLPEEQALQDLLDKIKGNSTSFPVLENPTATNLVPSPVGGGRLNQGQGVKAVSTTVSESVDSENQEADDWLNKGNEQLRSGILQGAIASYDKALEIKPDKHKAWLGRGFGLFYLGRYEEALESFDKALELRPDFHEAWNNRGSALGSLGRYEEAISSYDKVLEFKSNDYEVWKNKGLALAYLGRCEEAIISYDKALEIKPDYHEAWFNHGNALGDLGRNVEAIASFDKSLEIKPDYYEAWGNRGMYVRTLKDSYRAASGRPLIDSLQNPAIDQCGYAGEIANYRQGLKFCQQDTNSEGWGWLHWHMGWAHYLQGKNQETPFRLFREARREYALALETLTKETFPEKHLEVMQDYLKVYRVLEPANLEEVGQIAYDCSELLQKLIKLNPSRKESLERKFVGFGQITVDLMLQSGEVGQALEQIEKSKAVCLDWMLPPREPLTWTEMQNQMLDPAVALIYWYYSPLELHTILLLPQQAPQLIATTPVDALEKFLTTWNEQYSSYTGKDKTKETSDETWRQQLPNHLTNLTEILRINKIFPLLQEYNIQNLTLIPHRDLHRLPLHALFPQTLKTRYLPTLHLTSKPSLLQEDRGDLRRLLSIQTSESIGDAGKKLLDLPHAALESAYICHLIGEPLHRIKHKAATPEAVIANLHQGCEIFHFTGHASYNFQQPVNSALYLYQKDRLTIADIVKIPLGGCELVCLSACETGITGKQTILDEYMGLVSAFLAQGVSTVVSTLWTVESKSSAIAMIEFYRHRYHPEHPQDDITALQITTQWLRTVTVQELRTWWADLKSEFDSSETISDFDKIGIEQQIGRSLNALADQEPTDKPYSDPYHWATFTITGG